MTGRITDAYTNIATVKLFSHAQREASYARSAMQDFMATVHRQMRMVTGFEVANHSLSIGLILATSGATLGAIKTTAGCARHEYQLFAGSYPEVRRRRAPLYVLSNRRAVHAGFRCT